MRVLRGTVDHDGSMLGMPTLCSIMGTLGVVGGPPLITLSSPTLLLSNSFDRSLWVSWSIVSICLGRFLCILGICGICCFSREPGFNVSFYPRSEQRRGWVSPCLPLSSNPSSSKSSRHLGHIGNVIYLGHWPFEVVWFIRITCPIWPVPLLKKKVFTAGIELQFFICEDVNLTTRPQGITLIHWKVFCPS